MPTGPQHRRLTEILLDDEDNEYRVTAPCRCTLGTDHDADEVVIGSYEDHDDSDDDGESLSASDAEDIWRSSGMDEDYDFR